MTLADVQALGTDVAREPLGAPRAQGEDMQRGPVGRAEDKSSPSGGTLPDQARDAELEAPQRDAPRKETGDVALGGRQTTAGVAGETGGAGAGDQGSLPAGKPDTAVKQEPALQGEVRSRVSGTPASCLDTRLL